MNPTAEIPSFSELPGQIYFRYEQLPAMEWQSHSHPWGQLNYVSSGVMNLEIDGVRFVSPPQYTIWIPPHIRHASYTVKEAVYRSAYVSSESCNGMPVKACIMDISPVLRAILDDFAARDVRSPTTDEDLRMALVALDQIRRGHVHVAYLPCASSNELAAIFDELQRNPGDGRSAAEFAAWINTTPRTLERKCQREIGMSFSEWRQRLKFVHAIQALDAGHTVQRIAYDLGYATTSAFIVMFKRITSTTPDQYRLASKQP